MKEKERGREREREGGREERMEREKEREMEEGRNRGRKQERVGREDKKKTCFSDTQYIVYIYIYIYINNNPFLCWVQRTKHKHVDIDDDMKKAATTKIQQSLFKIVSVTV